MENGRNNEDKPPKRIDGFINLWGPVLLAFGTIHLELLTHSAIMDRFGWCGTPQMHRKSIAAIYVALFIPMSIMLLIIKRKKKLRMDSLVRVCCLTFLAAGLIYWFFECRCSTLWLASDWY